MIYRYSFSILAFLVICFSCTEQTIDDNSYSDIIIKTGTVCGWCTVNDTLTISGKNLRFVNYSNCSTTKASIEKNGELTNSELEKLVKLLDFEELKKLDMNSCNVCFDGCDDWITYSNGSDLHTIRYSRNDPKLKNIQAFVDELMRYKAKYSGEK